MRKAVMVLSVALVASSAACSWLWMELQAEREANRQRVEVHRESTPVEVATRESQSGRDLVAPASTREPINTGAEFPRVGSEPPIDDWRVQQRRLLKDPNYFAAQLDVQRAQMAGWRDDAVRLLGLTRNEADALITAHAERRLRQEIRDPVVTVDVTPEGLQRAREAYEAEERTYQDQLRMLVGEGKSARWIHYLESRFARRQVENLRSQFESIDALRDHQVEPLISALHEESSEHQRQVEELAESMVNASESPDAQRRLFERQRELLVEANRRRHVAAARILSSAQLKRFDELLQLEIERQQADQRAALIQSEIEARQPQSN